MKQVLMALAILAATAVTNSVGATAASPEDVIRGTADEVINRIKSNRDELRGDPAKLHKLVNDVIFPHFDFPRMSQWVLGKHWKGSAPDVRARFLDQFKNLLVHTYATALLEYSVQTISYFPVNQEVGSQLVTVKTEMQQPGSTSVPISYKMHSKDGPWKVYDVAVDGVSLISTYRASFASEIRRNGIEALIKNLNERTRANQ